MGINPDMLFALVSLDLASQGKDSKQAFAAEQLEKSLLKKWAPTGNVTAAQEQAAVAKFLQANDTCSRWEYNPTDCLDQELLDLFQEEWFGFLGVNKKTGWGIAPLDLSPIRAIDYGRTGPGKSTGVSSLTFYGKMFANNLSASDQDLYELYRAAIQVDERWSNAEKLRYQMFGMPLVVGGGSLSVVLKNVREGRAIIPQPSLNGFIQLGQGLILQRRLDDYFGIKIAGEKMSAQHRKNQELARIGSVTGEYATLDLSSASDSISLKMLKRFTPPDIIWALCRTRTEDVAIGRGKNKRTVALHMISSMGNGYTFPLETAIFSCVVAACFRFAGVERINPYGRKLGNWAVFGDDIIVPTKLFRPVNRLLSLLGFSVNAEKTFSEGPFRESCGADWYEGYPVRGVYLKQLESLDKRFVAYNGLREWSKRHKLHLDRALTYLLHSIPHKQRLWVPPWENPEAGLRTDEPITPIQKLVKVDKRKHIGTYTVEGFKYRRLETIAEKLDLGCREELDELLPFGTLIYNPDGLRISYLGGYIRDGFLSLPAENKSCLQYRTGNRITLNWNVDVDPRLVAEAIVALPNVSSLDKHAYNRVKGLTAPNSEWCVTPMA